MKICISYNSQRVMYRYNTENALLPIHSDALSIYFIVDSVMRNATLTLILLRWRILWAPNNASRWQMGFNWALKGLNIQGFFCVCVAIMVAFCRHIQF